MERLLEMIGAVPLEKVEEHRLAAGGLLLLAPLVHVHRSIARRVAHLWYVYAMARVRISTTVDERLLASARRARSGLADSALIDEALASLLARRRAAEIDAAYAAYDAHPLDEGDEWGDLAAFRVAAASS